MFFAKPGQFPPCGMFSLTHLIVLFICICLIITGVFLSRHMSYHQLTIITRIIAIGLVILETSKMIFSYFNENKAITSILPLHFCSIFIYATILAGFTKGIFQKVGEAFIASGAIVAGGFFLVMPTTSVTIFPMFHFLSCYSMLFHSLMVYLGITYLITKRVSLNKKVFLRYSVFCTIFAVIAYVINLICDSNLMFLKEPYNIPITLLADIATNVPFLYSLIIYASCTYGTYFIVYAIYLICNRNVYKENVILTNMCLIENLDTDEVVVINRIKDWKGVAFPGGHIEKGEAIVPSVIREIKEETGLDITNLQFCGIRDWFDSKTAERNIVFMFKTSTYTGELIKDDFPEGMVEWRNLKMVKEEEYARGLDKELAIFYQQDINEFFSEYNEKDDTWNLKKY